MGSLKQWITVFFKNLTTDAALSACDNMIDENKYSVYAWLLIIRGYWMQQQGDKAFQWIIFQKRFVWLLSNPFFKN